MVILQKPKPSFPLNCQLFFGHKTTTRRKLESQPHLKTSQIQVWLSLSRQSMRERWRAGLPWESWLHPLKNVSAGLCADHMNAEDPSGCMARSGIHQPRWKEKSSGGGSAGDAVRRFHGDPLFGLDTNQAGRAGGLADLWTGRISALPSTKALLHFDACKLPLIRPMWSLI